MCISPLCPSLPSLLEETERAEAATPQRPLSRLVGDQAAVHTASPDLSFRWGAGGVQALGPPFRHP